MREPRAAVMIAVEATWEDHGGVLRTIAARVENKSASGACIRIDTPIPVGSRLNLKSHREQFAGTAKYCISDDMEYLVGIERGTGQTLPAPLSALRQHPPPEEAASAASPARKTKPRPHARSRVSSLSQVQAAPGKLDDAPLAASTDDRIADAAMKEHPCKALGTSPTDFAACLEAEVRAARHHHPPQPLTEQEKRLMRRKWLESALWSNKQQSAGGNGSEEANGNGSNGDATRKAEPMLQLASLPEQTNDNAGGDGILRSHVEYLPMEDIYLAAGIVSLRRGYSVNKVVEMLRSEHMRGLSKEMKRAALLMALDAAGISVAEVLSDARVRQDTLDAYEARQRKQAEAEWARKAEEIAQIQAELDRVKEQYMARINRHLEAVARDKAAFSSWQAVKKQESQSMTEAAELCLKASFGDTVSRAEVSMAPASSRTM